MVVAACFWHCVSSVLSEKYFMLKAAVQLYSSVVCAMATINYSNLPEHCQVIKISLALLYTLAEPRRGPAGGMNTRPCVHMTGRHTTFVGHIL